MQDDNKIDLSKLNKSKSVTDKVTFSNLFRSIFSKKDGIQRDSEGKFTSGSGGLNLTKKLNIKRMLPVVLVVAVVGGLLVFRSFAATNKNTTRLNGKMLVQNIKAAQNGTPRYSWQDMSTGVRSELPLFEALQRGAFPHGGVEYGDISSDGTRIYGIEKEDNTEILKLVSYSLTNGGDKKVITTVPEGFTGAVKLTPDGSRLIFKTARNLPEGGQNHGMYVVNLDGTELKELSEPEGDVRYSILGFTSSGKLVYYFYKPGIENGYFSINYDGSAKERLNAAIWYIQDVSPVNDRALSYYPSTSGSMAMYSLNGQLIWKLNDEVFAQIQASMTTSGAVGISPDGRYVYFGNFLLDSSTGEIVKRLALPDDNVVLWQSVPAVEEKRDHTCTLEIVSSSNGYVANWTSTAPSSRTVRLFSAATSTNVPNLPVNGSLAVTPKPKVLNSYQMYFNDPSKPGGSLGCSAELDLTKAYPTQPSDPNPPNEKRTATQ